MKNEIINPITNLEWFDFITKSNNSNIFHHPSWFLVLNKTYGYKIYAAIVRDANDSIICGLPFAYVNSKITGKRILSLPFTDRCDIICESEAHINILFDMIKEYSDMNKCMFLELRSNKKIGLLEKNKSFLQHIINLDKDTQTIFNTFDQKSVQWGIKKSIKMGVKVKFKTDINSVTSFIHLNVQTRKKHGILPQPDKFFYNIQKYLFENDLGFIAVAYLDDLIIAASVFLFFNGKFSYKYNASDSSFLNYQPNNLILWETINWAVNNGGKLFDFGRSDLSNLGLVSFKRRWGTTETPLDYYTYPVTSKFYESQKHSSWKFEAMKFTTKIMPSYACRKLGGAIYKHFA